MAVSSSDFKFSTTGIHQSSLSPKYLHTNSTSHTWPFSAIAELIDNSYDPDVKASQLWIGEARINSKICLTFTDNGNGMQRDKLYKMLSFGFCEKVADGNHMPVGHYGNGFKSGSMRLGKDALVLTKQRYTRSIGYLSQTYLEAIKAETVVVPIATWDHTDLDDYNLHANSVEALRTIYEHSLIKTEKELNYEFDQIDGEHGTRIIISNIRTTADNQPEFDFVTDQYDIRIPDDTSPEGEKYRKTNRQNHVPECDYSLRAYCAILYLKPKMQIFIRQKKVKTLVVEKSLSNTEVDRYRPTCAASDPVKVVFGFNSQNKNHYGIMMYHRNRLIKPYERVGYQLKANNLGVGVVGVVQCDFLQPTHNKQDFDYTKAYRACINALGQKLNEYWNEKKGPVKTNFVEPSFPEPQEVKALPDQTWVQCDKPSCLKWRKLPDAIDPKTLPDKWYCDMNPDPNFKSCDAPEEKEEENVVPYEKKQKKRLIKEMEAKQKREQATKKEQDEKIRSILAKEEMLKKREEQLTLRESGNITSPKIKIEGSPNSTRVTSQKSSSSVASNSKLLNGHSALRTPTNSQSSPRTPAKVQPTSFANLTPLTPPILATNQLTPASQSSGFVLSALKSSISNRLGVASSSPTQKVTLIKTNTDVTKMNSAKLPCRIIKTNGETFILQGTQSIGTSLKLGVTTSSVNDVKPSTTASVFTAPVKILPKNGTTANATMTTPNTVRTVTIPSVLTKQPTTANATMTTLNTVRTVSAPILNKDVKPSPLRLAAVAYSGITGNKSTTPEDVRNVVLPGIKREPSETLVSPISAKIQRKNSSPGVIIIDPTPVQSSDSMQQKPLKLMVSADVRVRELEKKVFELQTELAKCNKDAATKTKNLNFLLEAKSVQIQHKDKEIVEKKAALKGIENTLNKKTKQLKVLRDNVCKLLQVLVPEIDVESEGHDEGIDDLLKQVLEANK